MTHQINITTKDGYQCPSCGYKTLDKSKMKRHMYFLKKPCPQSANNIQLTDEIKEYVLQNRVWHPPITPKEPSPTQIINNIMCINNYIASIDTFEKLTKYMTYNKKHTIDIEEKLDGMFRNRVEKLENDTFKHAYELDRDDFLNIIDDVSLIKDNKFEQLNIMYDDVSKKIKLYNGEWNTFRCKCAIKQLMSCVKEYYLDTYEMYLIKKLSCESTPAFKKQRSIECLLEYYKFLACLRILPNVLDDENIDEDTRELYYEKYKMVNNKMTTSDVNTAQKEVLDIIIKNSKSNIHELNKFIIEQINMDDDFRRIVMPQ